MTLKWWGPTGTRTHSPWLFCNVNVQCQRITPRRHNIIATGSHTLSGHLEHLFPAVKCFSLTLAFYRRSVFNPWMLWRRSFNSPHYSSWLHKGCRARCTGLASSYGSSLHHWCLNVCFQSPRTILSWQM